MNKTFRFTSALVLASAITLIPVSASAENKDMILLKAQIQQLQDSVARLQQSNDERMGVLKDLVQQSADSVNRMATGMDTLQRQLGSQQAAEGTKVDQVSGQVQSLNDSLDELKARLGKLEKIMQDVQSQQQTISAGMQSAAPMGTTSGSMTSAPPPQDAAGGTAPGGRQLTPLPPVGPSAATASVDDLYKAAMSDYMAAKYPVATSEFGDVIKSYPDDTLAGNSWFYLAEMDYRAGKYAIAAKDYDRVIEQFPDNNKVPAAHLHKGQALIQMKQNEAGVRELRALIQRFPNSPEAMQARSKLNGMGVPIRPRV